MRKLQSMNSHERFSVQQSSRNNNGHYDAESLDAHNGNSRSDEFLELDETESTIFVSVASYRDSECQKTIRDLFAKARHPNRLIVGICEQNYSSDAPCVDNAMLTSKGSQIRIKKMPAINAKGPAYARATIECDLYQPDESELFLQIDSHMRFTKNWDVQCIRELSLCPNDRSILTMYPEEYKRTATSWNFPSVAKPKYISFHSWHKRTGFPMQDSKTFKSLPSQPWSSAYFAANFAFGRSEAWQDVPNDIDCPYLFLGEEQSMAARFYTHGWDMYSPMTMLLYTLNDRTYRDTFWEQLYKKFEVVDAKTCEERKFIEQQSVERIQSLLRRGTLPQESDNALFGLGTRRSLKQYEEHAGYDFNLQIATPRARLGLSADGPDEEWIQKVGVRKQNWKNVFTASLSLNNAPLEGPIDNNIAETYRPGKNLYRSQTAQAPKNFVGFKHRLSNMSSVDRKKASAQNRFS